MTDKTDDTTDYLLALRIRMGRQNLIRWALLVLELHQVEMMLDRVPRLVSPNDVQTAVHYLTQMHRDPREAEYV